MNRRLMPALLVHVLEIVENQVRIDATYRCQEDMQETEPRTWRAQTFFSVATDESDFQVCRCHAHPRVLSTLDPCVCVRRLVLPASCFADTCTHAHTRSARGHWRSIVRLYEYTLSINTVMVWVYQCQPLFLRHSTKWRHELTKGSPSPCTKQWHRVLFCPKKGDLTHKKRWQFGHWHCSFDFYITDFARGNTDMRAKIYSVKSNSRIKEHMPL